MAPVHISNCLSSSRARQLLRRMQETLIETETEGAVNQDYIRQLSHSISSHLQMTEQWDNSTLGKSVSPSAQSSLTVHSVLR